jgi:hypothetical protein
MLYPIPSLNNPDENACYTQCTRIAGYSLQVELRLEPCHLVWQFRRESWVFRIYCVHRFVCDMCILALWLWDRYSRRQNCVWEKNNIYFNNIDIASGPHLEPLPPVNTGRRATILSNSKEMLHWKHMLQAYVSSVLNVLEVCCKCFIRMLQKSIRMLHIL